MSPIQAQNILEDLKDRNNLQAIQIKTSSTNFNNRFKGVSSMFRVMKNSLHSMQGISNRTYFKGLSGIYFSECNGDDFEIIIIYDTSLNNLNRIQVIPSHSPLLGMDLFQEGSERKELSDDLSRDFVKFGGIFDPAVFGMWLTGSDPRNYYGKQIIFDTKEIVGGGTITG